MAVHFLPHTGRGYSHIIVQYAGGMLCVYTLQVSAKGLLSVTGIQSFPTGTNEEREREEERTWLFGIIEP